MTEVWDIEMPNQAPDSPDPIDLVDLEELLRERDALRQECAQLNLRLRNSDQRRRAMVHMMDDLNRANKKLADQRKAMLHILADYEQDRSWLARQAERLGNSRLALRHILQDFHQSNLRLENGRKAMIHIMGDLAETTEAIKRREAELREKQEQLVQAAKLATLGELTTAVAHELNNPLNNIGLFTGNAIDLIEFGSLDRGRVLEELRSAMRQVQKASEIISHLRTFGRTAPISRIPVAINDVVKRARALLREQLRLRQITVETSLAESEPVVMGSEIQLEQVFINLLTNARDALAEAPHKLIRITSQVDGERVVLAVRDTGWGVPAEFEQRIFDPFFTTKEVGKGTGLGLSITYGIIQEHGGAITLENHPGHGATFRVELPLGNPANTPRELFT